MAWLQIVSGRSERGSQWAVRDVSAKDLPFQTQNKERIPFFVLRRGEGGGGFPWLRVFACKLAAMMGVSVVMCVLGAARSVCA